MGDEVTVVLDDTEWLDEFISEEEVINMLNMPCHVISGSGWDWFLDADTHQMVKTRRGSEVTPVACDMDEHNRVLVRASARYLLIPAVEVEVVGWN